jgi:8-oxo-dGTP pyrophosphatase MutT (NUDIX family)
MAYFDRDGEAWLVLTKRPDHMPSHQGEIAFPGGKRDEADASLEQTALREADEEIGLAPDAVEVVGEMEAYATLSSRFAIVPFVGVIGAPVTYAPDPSEVDKVIEVPVSELLADGVHREERWGIGPLDRPVHFFELEDETVWGATAGILAAFLGRLVEPGH